MQIKTSTKYYSILLSCTFIGHAVTWVWSQLDPDGLGYQKLQTLLQEQVGWAKQEEKYLALLVIESSSHRSASVLTVGLRIPEISMDFRHNFGRSHWQDSMMKPLASVSRTVLLVIVSSSHWPASVLTVGLRIPEVSMDFSHSFSHNVCLSLAMLFRESSADFRLFFKQQAQLVILYAKSKNLSNSVLCFRCLMLRRPNNLYSYKLT